MRRTIALALMLLALLVGVGVSGMFDGEPESEKPARTKGVDGLGAGYWLMKAIDETVGLPDRAKPYAAHAVLAREFLDAIETQRAEAALDMLSTALRAEVEGNATLSQWNGAVEALGAADAITGERRWSTMRTRQVDNPGEEAQLYTFNFARNHAKGSTISEVGVVLEEGSVVVSSFKVVRRHFRMRDR